MRDRPPTTTSTPTPTPPEEPARRRRRFSLRTLKAGAWPVGLLAVLALLASGMTESIGAGGPVPAGAAAPPSEDFDVRRYQMDLTPAPPTGTGGQLTGARIDLEGAPSMLVLLPESQVGTGYTVRSRNSTGWSEWIDVEVQTDEAPDGLEGEEGASQPSGIGPIWIGDDAEEIEVAALGRGGGLVVETLEPVARPDVPLVANALPGRPTIQPRTNWATRGFATDHEGCEEGPTVATNIRAAVVHHTVTGNSYSQGSVDDQLRAIYRLHVDINGWCDIAYNFVVDRFGTIWEARTGGIDLPVVGGHAKGFNTWTVGVALLGQHQAGASPTAGRPTAAAVSAVESLVGWKLGLHGVDPNGTTWLKNRSSRGLMKFPSESWVEVPTVLGHRDLGVTSCPGSLAVPNLPPIRTALRDGRVGSPPYSFVAHEPYEHGPAIITLDRVGGLRPAGAASQPLGELVPGGATAIAVDGGRSGGYVLTSASQLVDYGTAPTVSGTPSGSVRAVDLVVRSGGTSGWVLDVSGGIHPFGGAPGTASVSVSGEAVAFEVDDDGRGYVLDAGGRLTPVGGSGAVAVAFSGSPVDVGVLPGAAGGWILSADGKLVAFGTATNWQIADVGRIDARAVMAALNGKGGWVLDSEGRLHRFGDERPILPISSTVGVPTMVDAALIDWIADDRSDLIVFTRALSELFLGVPYAPLDADYAAMRVVYEGRAVVVDDLAHSEAWAGRLIDEMYLDVLGRPPDSAGRRYWVGRLAAGMRTQDLGAFFYGSPEYYAGSGSATNYVTNLYRELLGRDPDRAGLAFWVGQLGSGTTRPADISLGFYQSPESRVGRVDALYRQILRRSPDPDGRAYWAGQLLGIDDIRLAVELASSTEYYRLITADE